MIFKFKLSNLTDVDIIADNYAAAYAEFEKRTALVRMMGLAPVTIKSVEALVDDSKSGR